MLKIGTLTGSAWNNSYIIKNPLTGLGATNISQILSINTDNKIKIVASPDISYIPAEMKPINPSNILTNDQTTGWSFDNIIITSLGVTNNTITSIQKTFGFIQNDKFIINNTHPGEIIEIYNLTGRKLHREVTTTNTFVFSLQYKMPIVVRRINGNEVFVKKFIQ